MPTPAACLPKPPPSALPICGMAASPRDWTTPPCGSPSRLSPSGVKERVFSGNVLEAIPSRWRNRMTREAEGHRRRISRNGAIAHTHVPSRPIGPSLFAQRGITSGLPTRPCPLSVSHYPQETLPSSASGPDDLWPEINPFIPSRSPSRSLHFRAHRVSVDTSRPAAPPRVMT